MLRRAAKPQCTVTACATVYLNLLASNNLPANQTVAFVIQGTPWPKSIHHAQNIKFVRIREDNGGR